MEIKGGTVRLVDLLEDGQTQISNLDATGVTFVGPAVVVATGSTTISGCGWDAAGSGPEAVAWEIDASRLAVVGAVGLHDCSLSDCRFVKIGYGATAEGIANFFGASTV